MQTKIKKVSLAVLVMTILVETVSAQQIESCGTNRGIRLAKDKPTLSITFSTSWTPSGGSVIFTVPREHLAERLALYIPYSYEWEYGERTFRSDEPQHRIYFRVSDLPEKAQTKTK